MGRYYGEIRGSRGEASRMGTAYSGFHGWIRGWHVGAAVDMYPEDDGDRCVVYASSGSAGIERAESIGAIRNVNGALVLSPSDWVIAQVDRHRRELRNAARREARTVAKRAKEIANAREARGMDDPLNRLSAHIDTAIANGSDSIVEVTS